MMYEVYMCALPRALFLLPAVVGPGKGAAFLLRLMSPVHRDPKCMLVCLQVIIRKKLLTKEEKNDT